MAEEEKRDSEIRAVVEGDHIAIRIPLDQLQLIGIGGWAAGYITPVRIDDATAFAKEMCRAMNDEDEDGTTPLHRLIDAAIEGAVEAGEGEVIGEEEAETLCARIQASLRARRASPSAEGDA